MTISPTEAFAAMNEAVQGEGGKVLQRKFKVRNSYILCICHSA
jgi:predicted enzyme related to lactoylglutathione lyase